MTMKQLSGILGAFAIVVFILGCGATSPEPVASVSTDDAKKTETEGDAPEDPYLWLEEVEGEKALAFARELNEKSTEELTKDPRYSPLMAQLRGILDSKDNIPWIDKQGKYFYNFWRDEANPRGLWRRIKSIDAYTKKDPKWETVIDLDALAKEENENWVWAHESCLYPKYEKCLINLSRGGSDAVVVREFDTKKKKFVEGGFSLPEAKSDVAWKDSDTIYVGTDFGPGTLTDSGYSRLVKEWRRGTPLKEAKLIYECKKTDMYCSAYRDWDHGKTRDFVVRTIAFWNTETFLLKDSKMEKVPVPPSSRVGTWDGQMITKLREDWEVGGKTWPKGSLVTTPFEPFMEGKTEITSLYTPSSNRSLVRFAKLKSAVILTELEDVRSKGMAWTRRKGEWKQIPLNTPDAGSFYAFAVERNDSDKYWMIATDFTLPTTVSISSLKGKPKQLKQSPSFFDAKGLAVEQHFAVSKDGTKIPYFQVAKKDISLDGQNPTLLYGYGGFEASLESHYSSLAGAGWMEKGGVYILANIRGGGEYGPSWHQAAQKENKQRSYDDFIAVAEDLIARKVTTPQKLGISGASNGGLLMGAMLIQRPDLFGAIVCEVPLLDMKRYNKLLAGASWMAEYGDPDKPEEWAYISRYSPYQNVNKETKYPRTLFTTSTKDDRVHPGHARKMVARMLEQGHDVLYYENIEGGHGGAANNEQRAHLEALAYVFLARELGLE